MGGGGGISGLIDFPLYWRTMHSLWLTELNLILQAALSGASPYNSAFAYNPEPDLDASLDALDTFSDEVDSFGASEYDGFASSSRNIVDAALYPVSDIAAEVTAFRETQVAPLALSVGRLAAGMADALSSMTSAFPFAVAMLELENTRTGDLMQAQMQRERGQARLGTAAQLTVAMADTRNNEISHKRSVAMLRFEIAKATIQSQTARLEQELAIDVEDARWDLSLFTYAGNLMAASQGASSLPERVPRGQQMMSNAMGMISMLGPLVAAL